MTKAQLAIACALSLSACSGGSNSATLYRNSPITPGVRVHFATFDATESNPTYNINNCQLSARLLNANIEKLNDGPQAVGFWCETGKFSDSGTVPTSFEAQFPVD
jgi:hypothetical protein